MIMYKHKSIISSIFTLLICLSFMGVSAQNGFIVRGTVTEKSSGEPLIGVNIIEKNENDRFLSGTVTDFNGNYTLKVSKKEALLVFSFIGYKSQNVNAGGKTIVNVAMDVESAEIDEIAIMGRKTDSKMDLGISTIAKRDIGGSITSVNMEAVKETPVTTVEEMLQGRAAGVQATAISGDPGAGFTIRIRGTTSLMSGNDPLYVVDGIPIIAERNQSGLSDYEFNPLSDIDPEDIESMTILKDASATAIYGSRGANGVVIIKTKRGKQGRTTIAASAKMTLQKTPRQIPMLNGESYKMLMLEADQFRGGDKYHQEVQMHLRDDPNDPDFELHNNDTDWMDEISQLGFSQQYSFSIRGGGQSTAYAFSTGYTNQTGTILNTGYRRFNTRFNLDNKVSKNFKFGSSIAYTNSFTNKKDLSTKGIPGVTASAQLADPTWPVYDQDSFGNSKDNYAIRKWEDENTQTMSNPVAFLESIRSDNKNNRFTGSVFGTLNIAKGLTVKTQFSTDISVLQDEFFIPPEATGTEPGDKLERYNKVKLYDKETMRLSLENTVNYAKTLGENHHFNFILLQSVQQTSNKSMTVAGTNSAGEDFQNVNDISTFLTYGERSVGSSESESALSSLLGRMHYKYKDNYSLTATVRRDGSSKFGGNSRYAILPALAGWWRMSAEDFMSGVSFVDDLKWRFSWGYSGNGNIGSYKFVSRYASGGSNHYLGTSGVKASNIRLDNLKWETTEQINIGVDATFFENRVSLTADAFLKTTRDMLWNNNTLPTSSGFSALYINSGDVENKGIDLNIDGSIINKRDLQWKMSCNVSLIRNKMLKLPEGGQIEGKGNGLASGYRWRIVKGDPIGAIYGYRFKGVYSRDEDAVVKDSQGNTVYNLGGYDDAKDYNNGKLMKYGGYKLEGGDAIYEDLNNDGIIDELDITQIGDANPDFYGGFINRVTYKNFTLSMVFQYQVGNDVVNAIRLQTEKMSDLSNQSTATLRRWRKQGDLTDMPKAAHQYKNGYNYLGSDRFIEDGSYLRLKSVNLTYEIPKTLAKKLNFKSGRIFMTTTNLYTWTNYIGQDPEVFKNLKKEEVGLKGVDDSRTPVPKQFTLGLNLNF
ncbi:TonB-dependent receptor [Puteibacter caeruleilacunae]|nr:TonB-dependent receptor [Puteibacter caeruleilacunae]